MKYFCSVGAWNGSSGAHRGNPHLIGRGHFSLAWVGLRPRAGCWGGAGPGFGVGWGAVGGFGLYFRGYLDGVGRVFFLGGGGWVLGCNSMEF